jgi:glucose-6-phosphate isomerase
VIHVGNAPIRDALSAHANRWQGLHLRDVIDGNAQQRALMSIEAAGLQLDFSRQRLDVDVLADLTILAQQCELGQARDAMLRGDPINASEGRAALHTAL